MAIRIATAPVSWGVMEVEGFGGQKPYGETLDEMVEAGYQGTELGPYGFLPTDPARLNAELSARGLTLVGAFVPLPLADPSRYEAAFAEAAKVIELLAQCGRPHVVLADEMAARPAQMDSAQWREAASFTERAARAAASRGLDAVFHHHAGTCVETPDELAQLCEQTDPALLGVCLDTGHYLYGGGDPLEAVARYKSRIRHLHFKDIRRDVLESCRRDSVSFVEAVRRGVFSELGQGAIDFSAVVRALLDCGYDGWAVFEQDVDPSQPGIDPKASAARSRQFLLRRVGI